MRSWDRFWNFMVTFLGTVSAFSPFGLRLNHKVGQRLVSKLSATPIKVVKNLPQADVDKMQIKTWATWGCSESKFPWSYGDQETAYLLAGKVVVTPSDSSLPAVTIEKGDLVVFPSGMSCTWDVQAPLRKHYKFD